MSDSSPDTSNPPPSPLPSSTSARAPDAYLGVALPKEALSSIALSQELADRIRRGWTENRVQTPLPKFFNPLFRRQGVVNKHALEALECAGQALNQLAREIESRDRVIELLAAHFNSYVEGARQADMEFARRVQQQVETATTSAAAACTTLRHEFKSHLGAQIQEQAHHLAALRQRFESAETTAAAASATFRYEIQSFVESLSQRVDRALVEQRDAIEKQYSDRLFEMERKLASLEAALSSLKSENESVQENAQIREESLVSSLRAASAGHKDLSTRYDTQRQDFLELAELCAALAHRQESVETGLSAARVMTDSLLPALRDRLVELAGTIEPADRNAIVAETAKEIERAQSSEADAFYAALEARFRGPRATIRERQSRYIPLVEDARSRVATYPPVSRATNETHVLERLSDGYGVLDLGSGRGEWLELLKEQKIPALGVELNRFFLQTCEQRGINVVAANLVEFLASAPNDSVAVVTGFHIIEHLPFPVLQEVIKNCVRILRRGGIAIFETPNPGNILTSALNFRLDPTHRHPIHPALAQFLLEIGGFSNVRLEYLHAYDESHHVGDRGDPLAERFNAYFHGPQDYAVIGTKP